MTSWRDQDTDHQILASGPGSLCSFVLRGCDDEARPRVHQAATLSTLVKHAGHLNMNIAHVLLSDEVSSILKKYVLYQMVKVQIID